MVAGGRFVSAFSCRWQFKNDASCCLSKGPAERAEVIAYTYCWTSSCNDFFRIVLTKVLKEVINAAPAEGKAVNSLCNVGRSGRPAMIITCISAGRTRNLLR